jgi:Tfp pilus assembly protein PilN
MHAVNLLPRDAFAAERSRLNLPLVGAGMVPIVALGLVIHAYGSAHSQVATAISELSVLNAQVAELAPARVRAAQQQQQVEAQTTALVAVREARLSAVQTAMATAPPLDTFLDQIARVLPNNVWLSALDATPSGATPLFSITGFTYSEPAVAQLLARLQLLTSLSAVSLSSSTATTVGTKTLIQFQISATPVVPTPAALPATTPAAPASTTSGPTTAAP